MWNLSPLPPASLSSENNTTTLICMNICVLGRIRDDIDRATKVIFMNIYSLEIAVTLPNRWNLRVFLPCHCLPAFVVFVNTLVYHYFRHWSGYHIFAYCIEFCHDFFIQFSSCFLLLFISSCVLHLIFVYLFNITSQLLIIYARQPCIALSWLYFTNFIQLFQILFFHFCFAWKQNKTKIGCFASRQFVINSLLQSPFVWIDQFD